MATLTIPNVRVSSDIRLKVTLTDNGVSVDWSSINDISAIVYFRDQRMYGARAVIEEIDGTDLILYYSADRPQFLGIADIVINCEYQGFEKTFDKPAVNFVDTTQAASGTISVTDDTIAVDIAVEEVDTSILDNAIVAAFSAAEAAMDAKQTVLSTNAEIESAERDREAAEAARVERAAADHTQAAADHTQAGSDHSTAAADHTQAAADHTQAGSDHSTAAEDHTQAAADHTQAGSDHSTAAADHTQAAADHTQAESDHSTAAADHTQAAADHTQAGSDHSTAAADHTQAAADHTQAGSDHSTAAADHTQAAADHNVVQGYDTRLTNAESEVAQLSQELTMRADSYTDADYIVRAQTGSSSLTDDASGTRLRLVFPVKAGDTIKISSTYPSGYSCGIWDSPAHCVQASGTTGMLQVIVNGYTTNPIEVIANQDGYLGVSFTNGNTAISDTTKQAMLNSLSIFVAGGIQNQLHEFDGRLTNAEGGIEVLGDEVLSLYGEKTTTTQTDPVTPTSYASRNGGLEDTSQPLPVGAQIIGVTLYSTGAGDWGDEVLYIYDENLSLVQSVALGRVGTTNTYFDISAQNIEVKEGYHYAIGPRVAYKYISGLPSGRFKWLPNNRSEAGGDGFLFTFTYKEKEAKVNDLQRKVLNNKQQFEQLVGVEDDFVFDLSSYVRQSFAIDNRSIAKSSASGVYTILFPIERYGRYSITAGETSCEYAILASNIVLNGLVSYATVKGTKETAVRSIPSGQTQIIEIDKTSNAKYLAIRADDSTVKAPARIAKINEISYRSIPFIGGEFVEYLEDTNNYIDAIKWRTAGGQYKGCLIPVTPGQRVKISAQVSNPASFVFIQEQEIVNDEDVIFADGYTAKIVVAAGGNSGVVTAPIDAAYLWVLTLFSGQNYKPSSIEFFPAIEAEGGIVYRNITKDAAFRSTGVQARNTDIKPLSFLHISDIHTRAVDYKCFANACALLEHYDNIKFGIVTGDLVYNDFTDPMTYYDEGLAETTKPVLNVIGNHDAGQYNVEKGGLSTVGTDAEVYAKYIEPYISSWGLKTDGSGTPHPTGKSYYFTDFTDEKIRLIVLCEFESDMEIDPNDPTKYLYSREYRSMRQAQVDWFINSLATTPSGYGVVIAWHQPNELKSEDNPFVSDAVVNTTATASIYTSSQNRAWLLRIIDAFQNKTALSFSFEQTGGVVGTINVSCDFTSVVGDFICVLAGHVHNDYIGHFDQYPNITVLAVGADNMTYTGKYCQRALGTPSEDLFNVVNIDRTRKKITILRVGADASITGQDRRRIQIDY